VLIAAAGDEARLAEILPALDRPDFSARMLPGADASPRLLAAELSRCENPTIVVLAMGAALRGEALRRLVEVFTSRRDAWLRLLVVEFEPKRVHALIAPIRRAAETFRQQLAMVLVTSSRSETTAAAYRLSARLEEFAPARERGAAVVIDDDDLLRDYVGPIPHHVRVPDVPRSRANLRVVLPAEEVEEEAANDDGSTAEYPIADVTESGVFEGDERTSACSWSGSWPVVDLKPSLGR